MSASAIASKPIFWGGVALITFAYFTAQGSSGEVGSGVETGFIIVSIAAGIALIIYANK